jgi:hypothetical protein
MFEPIIAIQCFVKYDTLNVVLNNIYKCINREKYTVVFCIDSCTKMPYVNKDHWIDNNQKVKDIIYAYKNKNYHKRTIILENDINLGAYQTCLHLMNYCMEITDYVIFIEDDIVLAKDALLFYEKAYDLYKNDPNLFAISSSSVGDESRNNVENFYKTQKCNWISSCEFGISKNIWNKYGHIRGYKHGDVHFGFACRNNNMYTVCPFVSRMCRLGEYHPDSFSSYYHDKVKQQSMNCIPASNQLLNIEKDYNLCLNT